MGFDFKSLPERPMLNSSYVLTMSIPALQMLAMENGKERWGPLTRLSVGSELHTLGPGFDEQTVRVRLEGFIYIVFTQDLAGAYDGYALAATA